MTKPTKPQNTNANAQSVGVYKPESKRRVHKHVVPEYNISFDEFNALTAPQKLEWLYWQIQNLTD